MLTPEREIKIRKVLNQVDVSRSLEFIESYFGVGYATFDGGWDLLEFLRYNLTLLFTDIQYDEEATGFSVGGWLFRKYPGDELSVTLFVTESYTGEDEEDEM